MDMAAEQTGLIIARALVYLLLLPAAGLPLHAFSARQVAAMGTGTRRATALLAVLAALASAWWLIASVSAMAATPAATLDRETMLVVAQATPLGTVLIVRVAALALLAAAILLERVLLVVPCLAGLAALATAAFTGHAGASEGMAGVVHCLSDTIHLAAAACWLAALVRFVLAVSRGEAAELTARHLARFAATGSAVVALLVVTGVINGGLIAGWSLPTRSLWTGLLAAKLALFAAMLGFAALNRWKLTPALERGAPGAPRALRRSLAAELGCGITLVGLVSVLGTLDPTVG